MERQVKERLIGAAVLVAAAVILIPEMLAGPHREQRNQPAAKSGEPPLKTYTIDLSQSPAAQGSAAPQSTLQPTVIEEPAPPPEDSAAPADAAEAPSTEQAADQATPESPPVENQPNNATSVAAPAERTVPQPQPPAVAAAPSQREVAPPATAPAVNEAPPARTERLSENAVAKAGNAWAVQLASLDDQAAANAMSEQLRDKGYEAFVVPFKKGGTTRYRVRIGPMQDRQAAGEVLRKVKQTTPGAIVVTHP